MLCLRASQACPGRNGAGWLGVRLAGLGQEQGRLDEINDGRFDVQVFGTSDLFTRDGIATSENAAAPKRIFETELQRNCTS